jgi:hypothetical protein
MKFIFIIILFIFALIVIVPSLIVGILRSIISMFGGGSSYNTGRSQQQRRADDDYKASFNRSDQTDGARKKVFDENEGEYVSFEEIKPSDSDKKQ